VVAALVALLAVSLAPAPARAQTPAPAAAPAAGALVIPAGTVRDGSLVILTGDVDVRGRVRGDVTSLLGDVTVGPGGQVTGRARSLFGRARLAGGRADGGVRSGWQGDAGDDAVREPSRSAVGTAAATVAWFAVLLVLGIGLLAGASPQLDRVAGALEDAPGRAVAAGIGGQLVLAPGLVVLVAALAVTVIGVLAVPLAVVLYVLAAAGLLTLGFLAAAFVLGRWMSGGHGGAGRPRAAAARGASLRALGAGLASFLAVWLAAALLGGVPAAGLFVRAAALAATWLAVTAGFGAALLSRGGRRVTRAGEPAAAARRTAAGSVPVWQTPTPVSGVVAARRPLAATPTAE
jgi:hypothetical protein